jgi:hypothetical protein
MIRFNRLLAKWSSLLVVTLASTTASVASGVDEPAAAPKWEQIAQVVNRALNSRADYKPGDLLAKSDVQNVLARLKTLGWQPADAAAIVALVPGDDEFMVKQLRGKNGANFMRHVAKYPNGYDRVDRLIRLPRGETITADLVLNPGGYQMIEYMATSSGGTEMGKMLSETADGKNFNRPTGRIYTAEQLTAALNKSFEGEKAKAKPQAAAS